MKKQNALVSVIKTSRNYIDYRSWEGKEDAKGDRNYKITWNKNISVIPLGVDRLVMSCSVLQNTKTKYQSYLLKFQISKGTWTLWLSSD